MRQQAGMQSRHHRAGFSLVFFAMIVFGIMALAALVIDVGFARLTQRQMQTAVDAAALEAVRFRDELPPDSSSTELDVARRSQANNIVTWTFDDDFNPGNGDDFNFGAGPRIDLGPGIDAGGTINAGQFINSPENPNPDPEVGSLPDPPVYIPNLQLNVGDIRHGDMVAGTFDFTTENPSFEPPAGDTNPAINEYSDRAENDFYVRRNFAPSSTGDAFLVRMRRIHEAFDIVDTEVGISSKGPEIPFLFGRGSTLPAENPDGDYLPRIHGIAVRATSIADARPAMAVGVPVAGQDIAGSLGIAVDLTLWLGLSPIANVDCFQSRARAVGDPVSGDTSTVTNETGFVGLFVDDGEIDRRIVAFGLGTVDATGEVTQEASQLIFAQNVSAVPVGVENVGSISQIIARLNDLRGTPTIVHAAVSAR